MNEKDPSSDVAGVVPSPRGREAELVAAEGPLVDSVETRLRTALLARVRELEDDPRLKVVSCGWDYQGLYQHYHDEKTRADKAEATVRELEEASHALDELVAPDPEKSLAQRIRDEFADFQMVIDHCTEVYDHFSRGRISKPNTLPREVISEAEGFAQEDTAEAIKEATEELEATVRELEQARDRWFIECERLGIGLGGVL
jgi:hypothetical protein